MTFDTGVSNNLIASETFAFVFNFSAPTTTKGQRHYCQIWAVNIAGRSLYPTNVSEQAIDMQVQILEKFPKGQLYKDCIDFIVQSVPVDV